MSMELIAIGGIGVAIISVGIALAGLILHGQKHGQESLRNLRVDMQEEFKAVRAEMQAGFKAQGEAISKLREDVNNLQGRMAHVEGLIEGLRESLTGRRVAEDTGQYDPG